MHVDRLCSRNLAVAELEQLEFLASLDMDF